ncbi:uncharacterized protein LOC141735166 isoform X2 [Larus michahellis]|uniref:uncharacterized protein LOC141735166 isoform X2 n=1 Tax=Larus michahellis TaxID=119627 RepID=UPI003D9AEFA1
MALLRKAKAVAGGRVALAAASKVPPSPWRTAATSNRLATCQRQGPTQDGLQKVLDHQPSLRAVHPLAVPVLHLPEDDGWDGQDQSRRPSHRCRSVSQPSGMIARRHHRRHRPGDRQAPVESQESNEEDADVHGSGAEVVAPAADGQAHGPLANAQGPDVDGTGEEGDHVGQGQVEDEEDGDAAPAGDGTAPEDNGVARQPHRRCHRQQGAPPGPPTPHQPSLLYPGGSDVPSWSLRWGWWILGVLGTAGGRWPLGASSPAPSPGQETLAQEDGGEEKTRKIGTNPNACPPRRGDPQVRRRPGGSAAPPRPTAPKEPPFPTAPSSERRENAHHRRRRGKRRSRRSPLERSRDDNSELELTNLGARTDA